MLAPRKRRTGSQRKSRLSERRSVRRRSARRFPTQRSQQRPSFHRRRFPRSHQRRPDRRWIGNQRILQQPQRYQAAPETSPVEVARASNPVLVEHQPEVTAVDSPVVLPVESAPAPAKPAWKDGVYTGWGYSRHGNIEAAVVIESGRIASATISQCRTRYSCSVIDKLPPQVAQRQGPEVDCFRRRPERRRLLRSRRRGSQQGQMTGEGARSGINPN